MVGEDLVNYVRTLRARLVFIGRHAQLWPLGATGRILFLPRTEPMPEEPSLGLDEYIEEQKLTADVVGLIYPDRRSAGYGLGRFRDHPSLDFTRIAREPDVHFAHARGFVAKTSAHDTDRLQKLVAQAVVVPA